MRVYLLRHGATDYNAEHRYQGSGDIPLSREGEAVLRAADFRPEVLVVSPLSRARRTAERIFPDVPQLVEPAFREMDFGEFEGRNYREMEHDPAYRAWVDGGCHGRCPGGKAGEFCDRVTVAFAALVETLLELRRETVAVVAHGGVQMAVMERFALPQRGYFDWNGSLAGGFVLETDWDFWRQTGKLRLAETVQYTRR